MDKTNEFNISPVICHAIDRVEAEYEAEEKGHFTASQLPQPVQITFLKHKHKHEIVYDYYDLLHALDGTVMHAILEDSAKQIPSTLHLEKRFQHVAYACGTYHDVSAKVDRITAAGILQDYKRCRTYAVMSPKREWEAQLNIGAWLADRSDVKITGIEVVAFLKDWEASSVGKDDYPFSPTPHIHIPLWPYYETQEYVEDRIATIKHALAEDEAPECSPEERWEQPTVYAVMKPGRKRSVKNHSDPDEAYAHAQRENATVQVRPGRCIRCEGNARDKRPFCPVANFCQQIEKIQFERQHKS